MKKTPLQLEDLWACFQGIVPAALSTCASDGTPNITFISQVYYVDTKHVAISFQFFNKTHRNVRENPFACIMVLDPRTLHAYRFRLRFDHSESTGPLFESMSLQLQAVASYSGMTDVFRLLAADVYEVLDVECLEGFMAAFSSTIRVFVTPLCGLGPGPATADLRTPESGTVARKSPSSLACSSLRSSLDSIIRRSCCTDEQNGQLLTIASHGYAENGLGSEVGVGEGLIGMVARARRTLYLSAMDHGLRYARGTGPRRSLRMHRGYCTRNPSARSP